MTLQVDRRGFLASAAIGAVAAAAGPWPGNALAQQLGLPFREFMRLSHMLTGKHMLSEEIGWAIFSGFMSDHGLARQLESLRDLLYLGGQKAPLTIDAILDAGLLDEDKRRNAAKTLVSAWYTGRYEARGEKRLVTYTHALMHRPTLGLHNIPTFCGGPPGYWAAPPREANRALL